MNASCKRDDNKALLTSIAVLTVLQREHCTCDAPRGYWSVTLQWGLLHVNCAELPAWEQRHRLVHIWIVLSGTEISACTDKLADNIKVIDSCHHTVTMCRYTTGSDTALSHLPSTSSQGHRCDFSTACTAYILCSLQKRISLVWHIA